MALARAALAVRGAGISQGRALAASLAVGITFQALTASTNSDLDEGVGDISLFRALELQERADDQQLAAGISFGIAGALAITSGVLFYLDRGSRSSRPARAAASRWRSRSRSLQVALLPSGGFSLSATF